MDILAVFFFVYNTTMTMLMMVLAEMRFHLCANYYVVC